MMIFRGASPAIDVKDRNLWARDPRLEPAYAELSERVIDAIYREVQSDFWQDIAPDIAREHGYQSDRNGHVIYSDGRSGGWLILACPPSSLEKTIDCPGSDFYGCDDGEIFELGEGVICRRCEGMGEISNPELQRWRAFSAEINDAMTAAGETFAQRLGEELAELEHARESVLIRGEN